MRVTWGTLLKRAELAGVYVWRLEDGIAVQKNGETLGWKEEFDSPREAYAFCTGVIRGQQWPKA